MRALDWRQFVIAAGRRVMSTTGLDQARAAAFADQALGIVNGGFLALMLSVGHRTRLFDVLATLPAATSAEIAAAAGLQERYVREWLGAMVTGRIVDYDPATRRYRLPLEHAAVLSRSAGPDNLAELAQLVAILGGVEDRIIGVFRHGGGVGYDAFERFHDWMSEASRTTLDATLLSRVLPQVPEVLRGLEAGIDVLDVGCGRGDAVHLMAGRFPQSRFTGLDLNPSVIAAASERAAAASVANAAFVVRDAAAFDAVSAYDLITAFDAIHDQADARGVLRRIRTALRPGGTFLMVDIAASSHLERNLDNPLAPMLFTISTLHCTTVSVAAGGEGLGACWGIELASEMLEAAGFASVDTFSIEGDAFNVYYRCRP